jgi:hypothetical protein
MKSSINRALTKRRLLELSKSTRNGKFIRVAKGAIDELEAKHEANMRAMVQRHPSVGMTITGS